MKSGNIYDHGFGTVWKDIHITYREGYSTSVTDYHEHGFYEINFILSGHINILLKNRSKECEGRCIVLTRPQTPHYISCSSDILYSRLYLVFTEEFIANRMHEWQALSSLFGESGQIIEPTEEKMEIFKSIVESIRQEQDPFRQRLLTYYLLSMIFDIAPQETHISNRANKATPYVFETLAYIEKNYSKKISSEEISKELHIGRTTLMTSFKKHTGSTVCEYLTNCRLKNATLMLISGRTLEYTAEKCGFSDSSGLIRAFKRTYGKTPKQYIKSI